MKGSRGPRAPRRAVTLKALSARLGLSPSTVSVILNESPVADSIPDTTKARVREAAARLGYFPNHAARSLRVKRSFTVGVVVPEISEGYASGVLSGVVRALADAGFSYLLSSHGGRPEHLQKLLGLLRARSVEGYVLINTALEEAPALPTVIVAGHGAVPGLTRVVVDQAKGVRAAMEHLARLGHRRLAFFKGHPWSADSEPRWRAIQAAARELGIEMPPELTIQLGTELSGVAFTPYEAHLEGYAYAQRLLARGRTFTAFFGFNDVSAIGAMRAFMEAGLDVPGDVSVVGFDDIPSASFFHPSLTTVRQPLGDLGATAARALLQKIQGGRAAAPLLTVDPELMIRQSTQAPPRRVAKSESPGRAGARAGAR